jgi:hypothetical protein
MRTTLTIDDELARELRRTAQARGQPFKQVVNEALRAGLRGLETTMPRPYRLTPAALGQPRAGIDLVKALRLAEVLEDDATISELEQRR